MDGFFNKKPPRPNWTKLWSPAVCQVATSSHVPYRPSTSSSSSSSKSDAKADSDLTPVLESTAALQDRKFDDLDLMETPYDTSVWKEYGTPGTPAPRLFVVTYNTFLESSSSCMVLRSAEMMGYKINVLGYWRLKAFDYMYVQG